VNNRTDTTAGLVSVGRRSFLGMGAGVLAGGVLLAACGSSNSSSKSSATTIHVGYNSSLTAGGVVAVGNHLGYFKDAGVNVVGVPFTSFPAQAAAFAGGSIDVAIPGLNPAINTLADSAVVASLDNELNDIFVIAPNNSSISSAADLKGKRVGYVQGTVSELVLYAFLQTAGLTLADVRGQALQPDGLVTAYLSSQLDAACIYLPFEATIAKKSKVKVLARPSTLGNFAVPMFWMIRRSLIKNNPDAVSRLLFAKARANDWRAKNLKEAAGLAAKASGAPDDSAYLAQVDAETWLTSQQISDQYSSGRFQMAMDTGEKTMAAAKLLKSTATVPDLVDTSLDQKALKAYLGGGTVKDL